VPVFLAIYSGKQPHHCGPVGIYLASPRTASLVRCIR